MSREPEDIYARHPRCRIINVQFPGRQAGYDTDWPDLLKINTLDYLQLVLHYGSPDYFKLEGDILFYALEIWPNWLKETRQKLASMWLPVRRISNGRFLFAAHSKSFRTKALADIDRACMGPGPELTLKPDKMKWVKNFPQPICRVGRGYKLDSPGGSPKLPDWLEKTDKGWRIVKKPRLINKEETTTSE